MRPQGACNTATGGWEAPRKPHTQTATATHESQGAVAVSYRQASAQLTHTARWMSHSPPTYAELTRMFRGGGVAAVVAPGPHQRGVLEHVPRRRLCVSEPPGARSTAQQPRGARALECLLRRSEGGGRLRCGGLTRDTGAVAWPQVVLASGQTYTLTKYQWDDGGMKDHTRCVPCAALPQPQQQSAVPGGKLAV
jgi:hypothetical protein